MNRKIKTIVLIIIVIGVIVLGLLIFPEIWEKHKKLAFLKESFKHCQNLENILADLKSLPEDVEPATTEIDEAQVASSLDCLTSYDIYFCNLMANEEEKRLCEESFYSIKALKEKNLDYCEKTGKRKLLCQAILKEDEALCEEGEKQAEASPFSKFRACRAVIKKDVKECENLEDETNIQDCKTSYYIIMALLNNNPDFCEKIENERRSLVHCKAALDINQCLKYQSEVQCLEIYLPQIAQLTKNPSVCEKIPYKDKDQKGRFFYRLCLKNAE